MEHKILVVKARRDPDAGVWFVEHSDLPGLNAEADTLEALEEAVTLAIADLIEEGNMGDGPEGGPEGGAQGGAEGGGAEGYDVPVELIAHASSRVRVAV